MATIKQAIPIILLAMAVAVLPISAHQSRLTLINNIMNLNLTATALGVLSTLNFILLNGSLRNFGVAYSINPLSK